MSLKSFAVRLALLGSAAVVALACSSSNSGTSPGGTSPGGTSPGGSAGATPDAGASRDSAIEAWVKWCKAFAYVCACEADAGSYTSMDCHPLPSSSDCTPDKFPMVSAKQIDTYPSCIGGWITEMSCATDLYNTCRMGRSMNEPAPPACTGNAYAQCICSTKSCNTNADCVNCGLCLAGQCATLCNTDANCAHGTTCVPGSDGLKHCE